MSQNPKQNDWVREILDADEVRQVILDWKHGWMNVTGTDEADRQNYFHRAFGVDANMQYGLARRFRERFNPEIQALEEKLRVAVEALQEIKRNSWSFSNGVSIKGPEFTLMQKASEALQKIEEMK